MTKKLTDLTIYTINKNATSHIKCEVADSFWKRFKGLMLRQRLAPNTGLFIAPCNSIHMCFMRFAIDAIYVDRNYRVLKVVKNLRPWLGVSYCYGAYGVIEVNRGEAAKILTQSSSLSTSETT